MRPTAGAASAPQATGVPAGAVGEFLGRASAGDGRGATRIALQLFDQGIPADGIITDLLAAAQRDVGDRWLRAEASVVDEHLVSSATQRALDALTGMVYPEARGPVIAVASAEGDWHGLPAQMFATRLRAQGFPAVFLGPSAPTDHVSAWLARYRPAALAVSITMPEHFPGAAHLVAAAHRAGIPVLAGGRAIAGHLARGRRLGADAAAGGLPEAVAVLTGWAVEPPDLLADPSPVDPAITQIHQEAAALAARALEAVTVSVPWVRSCSPAQWDALRDGLAGTARTIAAGRLVHEPALLTEQLDWLAGVLGARGVPAAVLASGIAALVPGLGAIDPAGARLAAAAGSQLHRPRVPKP